MSTDQKTASVTTPTDRTGATAAQNGKDTPRDDAGGSSGGASPARARAR